MTTWIDQGGYPLVRVEDDGSLAQLPFSYQGEPGGAIGSEWQVPVLMRSFAGGDELPDHVLMDTRDLPSEVGGGDGAGLVINAGGSGYYRVSYPTAVVELLAGRLADLAPLERYNLVSDTWATALAGRAPLADLVRLARALADSGERDPSVWSVVLGAVGLFERVVPDTDRPALAASVRSLLGPLSRELGWDPRDDDGERTPALRAAVLRTLGTVGDDEVVHQEAFRRFRSGSGLDPDIESAVLDIVAATGGEDEFEAFLARYRAPANPQEENRYLYALAAFNDPGLATRAFELATSEVRTQNAPFLVQLLLANRVTGPGIWERVTEEWDALVAAFPSNMLPRMLDGVRLLCNPPSLAERVTRFIEAHPLPAGGKTVEQILERLAVNVTFGQREAADLAGTLGHGLGLPGS